MKTLFIVVNDNGDGSYSLSYTFDKELINTIAEGADEDKYSYPSPGFDGDGFNYKKLTVPDECTYGSLGISEYAILSLEDFK